MRASLNWCGYLLAAAEKQGWGRPAASATNTHSGGSVFFGLKMEIAAGAEQIHKAQQSRF